MFPERLQRSSFIGMRKIRRLYKIFFTATTREIVCLLTIKESMQLLVDCMKEFKMRREPFGHSHFWLSQYYPVIFIL